jgi:ribosomal protein L20
MMNKAKIFRLAKGFRGRAKNCIRIARERVEKSLQYAYRDRRNKKREMRALWITRINAGSRQYGVRDATSPIDAGLRAFAGGFQMHRLFLCRSNILN